MNNRVFLSLLFSLTLGGMQSESKFNTIFSSNKTGFALNFALTYAKAGQEYVRKIGTFVADYRIQAKDIQEISKNLEILACLKTYYDKNKNSKKMFIGEDEEYTALLKSGDKIEGTYTQLTPTSGQVFVRILLEDGRIMVPMHLDNFFIIRDQYLQSQNSKFA